MCEYFSEGMSSKASLFGAAHAKRWWKALTTAKGPSGQPAKARHFILAQKIEEDMQRRQHSGICIESPDGSDGEGDVDDNEDDKEEDRYNPKTSGFHYNPTDGMYHLGPYKQEEEQEQEEQEQEEGDGRPEGDAGRAYYYIVFSQAPPHGRVVCVKAAWGPEHTAKPRPMPSTERQREQRIRKKCKESERRLDHHNRSDRVTGCFGLVIGCLQQGSSVVCSKVRLDSHSGTYLRPQRRPSTDCLGS